MNNKGQVLVVFLLTLPLILIIFASIIDNGNNYLMKRKIENEIKNAIRYRFNTEDDVNIIESKIKSNLEKYDINAKVFVSENYVQISLSYERTNIFDMILNKSKIKLHISFIGTVENDELIIRKD